MFPCRFKCLYFIAQVDIPLLTLILTWPSFEKILHNKPLKTVLHFTASISERSTKKEISLSGGALTTINYTSYKLRHVDQIQ